MKFFTLFALVLAASHAHASPVTRTCELATGKTGFRTISSDSGELGDNEDGSPVVAKGYLLVAVCDSSVLSAFFQAESDIAGLVKLFQGLDNGTRVRLTTEAHEPGMEGRGYETLEAVSLETGPDLSTRGLVLHEPYKVLF